MADLLSVLTGALGERVENKKKKLGRTEAVPSGVGLPQEDQDSLVQLLSLPNKELGKLINPSSRTLSSTEKFFKGALGRKGLAGAFADDAEEIGQTVKSSLVQTILGEGLRDRITQDREARELREVVGEGNTFGDLNPLIQNIVKGFGVDPKKDVTVPLAAAGPTRPIFTGQENPQATSTFQPDEFGGTFQAIGPTAQVDPAVAQQIHANPDVGGPLVQLLMSNRLPASQVEQAPGVEQLMRQLDPGLQASEQRTVTDLEGQVPDTILRAAKRRLDTDLSTPQQSAQAISAEEARAVATTSLRASGMPEEDIARVLQDLPDNLPLSTFNQVVGDLARGAQTTFKEVQRTARAQEKEAQQTARLQLKSQLQTDLLKVGSQLTLDRALTVKQLEFDHRQALQTNAQLARAKQAEEQDARRLEQELTVLEQRQGFTAEENQLNRDAAMARSILHGEQQLSLESLRQMNRVALATKKGGDDTQDTLKKYYLDLMKGNPTIAGQLADILASAPQGVDPFTDQAIRSALNDRTQAILGSQLVQDQLDLILNTDLKGNTIQEKMSSLFNESRKLLKAGVDVTPIMDQIAFMQENLKAGSQSTNVFLNEKPQSTQEATRFTALQQSLKEMQTVKSMLFDEDGSIDRTNIFSSGLTKEGVPFTEGREMKQAILNAVEARLRAESGAAVPDSEVERAAQRFIPNIGDSDKSIRNKIKRLEEFISAAISLVDPVGTQRLRSTKSTPVESLKEPATEKDAGQRFNELRQRGLSKEQAFDQMEKEGY